MILFHCLQGTTSTNLEDDDDVSFLSPKSQPPLTLFSLFLWQGTTSANLEDDDDEVSFLSPKSQPPMILFTVQYIFQFDLYATFFFA